MLAAPSEFSGTLSELFEGYIEPILPSRDVVCEFHEWMCRYVDSKSEGAATRVFPVRYVRGTTRRQIVETSDGTRIAPADNAPAWVVHALLMRRSGQHPLGLRTWDDFEELMTGKIATHMFDVPKCVRWSANTYGWYVAHIHPVKNRDTSWHQWDRQEVARRFFRTLHPCNLFLVPGKRNRELGENPQVISFMANRMAERYREVWHDFLRRSGERITQIPQAGRNAPGGEMRIHLFVRPAGNRDKGAARVKLSPENLAQLSASASKALGQTLGARYKASRLTFRRDMIEPLAGDEAFEVETPFGTFRFTKRQFYEDFPRIPLTASYLESGVYHGAKLHLKASHRRLPTESFTTQKDE